MPAQHRSDVVDQPTQIRLHLNLNQLKRQEEKLNKRIVQYLADLDAADKTQGEQVVSPFQHKNKRPE